MISLAFDFAEAIPMGAIDFLSRRTLTVDEYHKIARAGVFSEDERIELIDGELIIMAPVGTRHFALVNRLVRLLYAQLQNRAIVSVQNPIALLPDSEPQPDIALLRSRADDYETRLPGAGDVYLLIEVADSTLAYDRDVKLRLYARHEVAEVWLIDANTGEVHVCREPEPPQYRSRCVVKSGGRVSPLLLPAIDLAVDEIFCRP